MVGARTTLYVGVVAVGIAAVIGTPLGILAGMSPRWLGEFVMRVNDLVLAFPALLLAIMFGAVFGADTLTAMVAIGIATDPVVRADRPVRDAAGDEHRVRARRPRRPAGRGWPSPCGTCCRTSPGC